MRLPIEYSKATWQERKAVREKYITIQNGMCFYCEVPLIAQPPESILSKQINWSLFPPNFLRHPIHLQHNHATDLTEGAVHAYCNAVMWQYEGR